MAWLSIIMSACTGFLVSWFISHPSHPKAFHKRLPSFKLKSLEVLPNIKFITHSYEIHIHHWLIMTVIYITFTIYPGNVLDSHLFMQGLIFGGLGQGLTYSDRFVFIKKKFHPSYAFVAFGYCSLVNTNSFSASAVKA